MLISLLFTGRDSTCITTGHLTWSIEQVRKCWARGMVSMCGLALTTDEVTRRPCRREFKMKNSSGELLYWWDHLKITITEFIWSVSSTEALTQKCQRITQRRAQNCGEQYCPAQSWRALPETGFSGTHLEPGCREWKTVRTSWQLGTCPPGRRNSWRKAHRKSAPRTDGAGMAREEKWGATTARRAA